MPVYPAARKLLIPAGSNDPRITPRVAILHVDAGNAESLYTYFRDRSGGIESHFHIRKDGVVEQYRDTNYQADANYRANDFAVSIETQGYGEGEWTPAQIESIKQLLLWLNKVHGIPLVKIPRWDGRGVGYHTLFGAPSNWTPVAKSCPGPDRKVQFERVIVPWMKTALNPPKPEPKPEPKPTGPTRTQHGGSWNLRVGRNPDVVAREVQTFLKEHDLDFLTICEAGDYIDALTDSLKGYKVYAKFDGDGPARDSAVIARNGRNVTDLRVHRLERIGWERKPGRIGLHWPRSAVSVDVEGLRVMSVHMPPGPFEGPRFWRRGVAFDTSAHKLRRIGLRWSDRPWVMAGDWNVGKRVTGTERDPSAGWIASETGARIKGDGIDYVLHRGCRVSEYARHDFGTSDHEPITFTVTIQG